MDKMVIVLDLRARKNIRLQGYNYAQNGAYFITVCVKDRLNLLWESGGRTDDGRTQFAPTITGDMGNEERPEETPKLSIVGKIIDNEISKIPEIYENVKIDKYVIMPNHVHLIILIDGVCNDGQTLENIQNPGRGELCSTAKETPTISRIIKQFKGSISKQIGYSIWQKLFYDHIIRNDEEYNKIWQYIDENPIKWQNDCYYEQQNGVNPL